MAGRAADSGVRTGASLRDRRAGRGRQVSPDPAQAWAWYQKGADASEPTALARFGERDEQSALTAQEASKAHALLLRAFRFYAAAAERARDEEWPDEAWRHWRYRRATLARLLAREGMMTRGRRRVHVGRQ